MSRLDGFLQPNYCRSVKLDRLDRRSSVYNLSCTVTPTFIMEIKKTAMVATCLGLLALCSFGSYSLGQANTRAKHDIWLASSGAFERELVRTAQSAKILYEFKKGDPRKAELFILGQLQSGLWNIDTLVTFASEGDKRIANRTVAAIADYISPLRSPVGYTPTNHIESLCVVYHNEVQEMMQSITEKTINNGPSK